MTTDSLFDRFTVPRVNHLNGKCTTLPILSLKSQYSRNFHLAWLGFFVAFLSWFAFSPLIPDAIKADLKLTPEQIGNSNVISLCATLIVRLIVGPLVDTYGPRKVMAAILAIGAIPSGLAGTVTTASGLYTIRFFIGILGGTFVPCQAWTTTFFDKRVVGRANALVAGWGNSGGGFTFIIMIALYNRLLADGLSRHAAWRAAFAIVPVPILLSVAALTLLIGTDHPAGKWQDRHDVPWTHGDQINERAPAALKLDRVDEKASAEQDSANGSADVAVSAAGRAAGEEGQGYDAAVTAVDKAVNEPLTVRSARRVFSDPVTWLPALAYFTTFGYELAIDANLASVLFGLYKKQKMGQTKAGYIAGIYGLLNIVTRPLGGYFGDIAFRFLGVPGKKHATLACGALQGALSLALGLYIDSRSNPSLAVVVVLFVLMAFFNEAANGANFSLVPHCNPNNNGVMSGFVGAMGNLGGVVFALIFRFQPAPAGRAFWICGIIAMGCNALLSVVRVPRV
ncbi:nitrate transporter [Punctularia strigosozonata HHB-11173 SS5]|uniref:nitrate transporter n=1 Tax=Punctularia strigosozonata (strain HHB-11173) TaxID=741275 RepID=UPI000441799F|nr:nitrate transporter [Punctularia strigosozonata HHB-11173 SS5]EIN13059.1 nitrate transporter [Punctularia strigosozonata HHB-11173 SS5]